MRRRLASAPSEAPPAQNGRHQFLADLRHGLLRQGQKEIPATYLYDDLGSALFDAITLLPEYGLTRADARLLEAHSGQIAATMPQPPLVVELGSGTGAKTRWVLSALAGRWPVTYYPIDISSAALLRCGRELRDVKGVTITALETTYLEGLAHVAARRDRRDPILLLFLGSSIGNFHPSAAVEFLNAVRRRLQPGDVLYLSTDLVKDTDRMLAAYDDNIGLTAAFNLNMLARINRELDADFDLKQFQHVARYDDRQHRIEMHLRSAIDQVVRIGNEFRFTIHRDETIWTESSYKFTPEQVRDLATASGFQCEQQWIDADWPFAQSLLRAA